MIFLEKLNIPVKTNVAMSGSLKTANGQIPNKEDSKQFMQSIN